VEEQPLIGHPLQYVCQLGIFPIFSTCWMTSSTVAW